MAESKCHFSPTSFCALDHMKDFAMACWEATLSYLLGIDTHHSLLGVCLDPLPSLSIALDLVLKIKEGKKPKTQQAPVQVSTAVLFKKSRSMLRSLGVHSIHHHLFLFISFWPGRHVYFITRYEPWKARRIVRSLVWRFIEADRSACDCAIKINAQLKCLCAIKIGAFLARHLHNSTVRSFHF